MVPGEGDQSAGWGWAAAGGGWPAKPRHTQETMEAVWSSSVNCTPGYTSLKSVSVAEQFILTLLLLQYCTYI